jgi:soluble lytic murein transglycosylase
VISTRRLAALGLALAALMPLGAPRLLAQGAEPVTALGLTATAHPPVPTDPAHLWIAPPPSARAARSALTSGVNALVEGRADAALALLSQPATAPELRAHQQYYRALALTRLGRGDEAGALWEALTAGVPEGALGDAVRLSAGEFFETAGRFDAAVAQYDALARGTTAAPDDLLLRLGRARLAAGDRAGAVTAFTRLHEVYPLSDLAATAEAQLTDLNAWAPLEPGSPRFVRELLRAERLFAARRYAQARDAFEALLPAATGDDHELVSLRLAECDHYLKRHDAARAALAPWLDRARRQPEARFFHLTATRELGGHAEYVRLAEALVKDFPAESWAEETLNNLATHYIVTDEDALADAAFRQLLKLFPAGRHAPRAAWKVGWNAYRQGRHAEAAETFEQAAAAFPRDNYRPSWLYWAARSRDQLGDTRLAHRLYGIVVADYLNSYYGRLAARTLTSRDVEPLVLAASVAAPVGAQDDVRRASSATPEELPTAGIIRALITHALYDDALAEVRWAQKTSGDSPGLQATLGLIYSRKGDLRQGINAVKRAYPQYLAAGGEELPADVLEVLFPVAYWRLIEKYAPARGLDPYLVAALMAQESTFDAGIRSHANAIGLMQVLPSTGRRYARQLKIPRFTAAKLTDPEINVRIGTAYFADMVARFGGIHHALASYNAGPSPVARWIAEKPGVARDEFIDDIPYPETQNYVKRILGTAEDYRRLYTQGGGRLVAGAPGNASAVAASSPAPRAATLKKASTKTRAATTKKKAVRRRR